MSVEFDENNTPTHPRYIQDKPQTGSKMGDWLVKKGLATGPGGANIILIIIAILVFGLSVYFFVYGLNLPFQGSAQGHARDFDDSWLIEAGLE